MIPLVTVWTKPVCPQCRLTKALLERLGVPYNEADLTAPENADRLEWFISEGYKSAPITTFLTRTIAGFDPDALKKLAEDYWELQGDAA